MRKARRRALAVVLGLVATVLVPRAASANEPIFGVRFGYYADIKDPFVGAEFLVPVTHSVWFNPNAEYVFVDGEKYMTFNADFHYDFPSHRRAFVWLGAGLGLAYVNPDGPANSDTDVAANFLAGVGLSRGPVIPYFQFKLIAKNNTEAVFAFGLRF
jgi:hypothetical protein